MGVSITNSDEVYESKPRATPQLFLEIMRLCEGMYEAQVMCDQVRRRLAAIANVLGRANSSDQEQEQGDDGERLRQAFDELLTRFHEFLERFVRQEVVFRLTGKRVVVRKIKAFHEALDALLKDAMASQEQDEVHEWHDRFENACVNLHIVFAELSRDRMALLRDLMDLQSQQEALTLIMYEYKRPTGTYTKSELQVIQNAFNTITRFSRAKAPVVPKWFIPLHDVEFQRAALSERYSVTGVEVHRGMVGEAVVLVTFVRPDLETQQQAAFVKAVESWFVMSGQHPNVTRFYGASHVGELFFATESSENSSTLNAFVAKNPTRVWEKLYEVALGLQFLHEHKVIHGDMRPRSIQIDAEGVTKIADNIVASLDLHDSKAEVAWRRAPENLDGDKSHAPTLASDVYAFGACIEQAVKLASSSSESDTVDQSPTKSEIVSEDQSIFLRLMCAELPEVRPDMNLVVERLQEFAAAEEQARKRKAEEELAQKQQTEEELARKQQTEEELARKQRAEELAANDFSVVASAERQSTTEDFAGSSSRRGSIKETKDQKRERKKREREDRKRVRRLSRADSSRLTCVLQ